MGARLAVGERGCCDVADPPFRSSFHVISAASTSTSRPLAEEANSRLLSSIPAAVSCGSISSGQTATPPDFRYLANRGFPEGPYALLIYMYYSFSLGQPSSLPTSAGKVISFVVRASALPRNLPLRAREPPLPPSTRRPTT